MVNNKLENRLKKHIKQNKYLMVHVRCIKVESLLRLLFISNIEYEIDDVYLKRFNSYYYTDIRCNISKRIYLHIHDKKEMNRLITCFNTLGIYNKNRFNFIRQMVWKYLDRS